MNIKVISYSFTGNNEALASSIAKELSAVHIKISEPKPRTIGTIILDMIFNRVPQVKPTPGELGGCDLLLFLGPVWMGQVATPLRPYLKHLKKNPAKYGFISISGGADAGNLKLSSDLEKRAGTKPSALIDLHIADLLPSDKPDRKDTSSYHIDDKDIKKLTAQIMTQLKPVISNLTC
jgi:hypothetical protein